jgi:hypothetical protein
MKLKNALLILACVASASAVAQTGTESATRQLDLPPPAPMLQLEPRAENGVIYLCGGVGTAEAEAMKQAAREYDLMVTFAASNGAYLADVNVVIADARGRSLLQTNCDAPIMLVSFEQNGNYRLRAEASGHTLSRNARVRSGGKVRSIAMVWPMQAVDMTPPRTTRGAQSSGGTGMARNGGASAR